MELGVSHVQNLSSLTPIVDNIFDKNNKNLVPIRSLTDHDSITAIYQSQYLASLPALLMLVNVSISTRFNSKAPAWAPCQSIAYSPDTW